MLASVWLPCPKFVFEVVAVGLQDVEGLVLDLPAGTPAGGDGGGGVLRDGKVGDEAVAVGHLAVGLGDLDLQPVDGERVGAVAQRHAIHPAIAMAAPGRAPAHGLAHLVQHDAMGVFAQRLVAGRLAHEDEAPARGAHRLADRLAGIEIVAQIDRSQPGHTRPQAGQPAAAPRGSRSPASPSRLAGARTPAPEARRGAAPAPPERRRQSCGNTPPPRPAGASSSARSGSCRNGKAPSRPARSTPDRPGRRRPDKAPAPSRSSTSAENTASK